MNIVIGADELILWLRKNKKSATVQNREVGRKIGDLICGDRIGGKFIEENPSYWALDAENGDVLRINLPRTASQYQVDVEKMTEIYKTIALWE